MDSLDFTLGSNKKKGIIFKMTDEEKQAKKKENEKKKAIKINSKIKKLNNQKDLAENKIKKLEVNEIQIDRDKNQILNKYKMNYDEKEKSNNKN